jgi:radical SAM superfamily enzyme with C-terminal helix-hairpin-helix motif
MASVIDEKQYPVYTLDSDPEMAKKKNGNYSIEEILEAVEILNEQN